MPFIHNNQPIQTLSTDRPDQPLAIRIGLFGPSKRNAWIG